MKGGGGGHSTLGQTDRGHSTLRHRPLLRGHVQTIFGKINVIMTLRAGPPPLNVMDCISYKIFYPHPLLSINDVLMMK